jgi:hypothetical protein
MDKKDGLAMLLLLITLLSGPGILLKITIYKLLLLLKTQKD